MILSDVFERFSQDSPLSVMAQGLMVNALSPRIVDQLFEDVAERHSAPRRRRAHLEAAAGAVGRQPAEREAQPRAAFGETADVTR